MPPAARQGDHIFGTDTHVVMVPSPSGQTPTPLPGHIFNAPLSQGLSEDVRINGKPAAVVGSVARTTLAEHRPMQPGVAFQTPPAFEGRITMGSSTVLINGKPAARAGDPAITCNDPPMPPPGTSRVQVTPSGNPVNIG